ncbi:hypothetical protein AMJ40_03875 [candidate division TA06 bacterium DG_26]|uniref:Regulatory protein RecX n=1 Tax=candidate division TA06 bacterium DG_26 TaxID=1703771 RepID=A0A0S7WIS8_UNCT6|nr:MAG: hypothetical protein AMJ40_03875 [candidate division TA06 bacterium DG_26]
MRITKIQPQRGKKKYSIWIDGTHAFSCGKEVLSDLSIKEGQELSSRELETLLTEIQKREARKYSLSLLERRALSEAELKGKLRRRGYGSHIIDTLVRSLKEVDLIDDLNYARSWVRNRSTSSPRGALLLRRELKMKGIEASVIHEVMEEFKQIYDEGELLAEVAEKRAKQMSGLDSLTRKRRLFGYLLRRGFTLDEVKRVVTRY